MTVFDPTSHKLITSSTANLKDAVPVDVRDLFTRLLSNMGLSGFAISNTAPSDLSLLWYHKSVRTPKRYNPNTGEWETLTPGAHALNIIQRAVTAALTVTAADAGDLFIFWDTSAGEARLLTRENLMKALGSTRTIATAGGLKGGGDLSENRELSLDVPSLNNTAALADNDFIPIFDTSANEHRKVSRATFNTPGSGYPVGCYVMGAVKNGGVGGPGIDVAPLGTVLGSNLILSATPSLINSNNTVPPVDQVAVGIGTWRNMGGYLRGTSTWEVSLFCRIS